MRGLSVEYNANIQKLLKTHFDSEKRNTVFQATAQKAFSYLQNSYFFFAGKIFLISGLLSVMSIASANEPCSGWGKLNPQGGGNTLRFSARVNISPVVVRPDIAPAVQELFNLGPNRWVKTGLKAEGKFMYQRGLSGDHTAGPGAGLNEALDLFKGEPEKVARTVSLPKSLDDSEAVVRRVNSGYSRPLTIRGRADAISPGRLDTEGLIPPGNTVSSVEDFGLFFSNNPAYAWNWARNYLELQDKLVRAGMVVAQDSRGARFTNELRAVFDQIKYGPLNESLNSRPVINMDELEEKLMEVFSRYP
jgi:hypothetical protein